MAHARLGPSNHRWPNCPGSVLAESMYGDSSSAAAVDGTGTHLLCELGLLSDTGIDTDIMEWEGRTIGEGHEDCEMGWYIDFDRAKRAEVLFIYLRRRRDELGAEYPGSMITFDAESQADPGGIGGRTDWWGTVDVTITVWMGESAAVYVEVVDYKDGRGWVAEKDNSQLQAYWIGKARPFITSGPMQVRPLHTRNIQTGRMTIVQPKTNPPIRYQDVSTYAMIEVYESLERAADATDNPDAPLVPDDKGGKGHCQWCKHKKNCSARLAQGAQGVAIMTNLTGTDGGSMLEQIQSGQLSVTDMAAEQLTQALDALPMVKALIDSVESEATRRSTEAPGSVPGYEMGAGRKVRVWAQDAETTEKMLKGMRLKKDQIHPAKLATPAQIEKLEQLTERQKKKLKEEMITEMDGKPKLVKCKASPAGTKSIFDNPDFNPAAAIAPQETTTEAAAPAAVPSFL